jgi:phosphinothricin tripeptide acetyl hydrolase
MANEALQMIIDMLKAGLPAADLTFAEMRAGWEQMVQDAPIPEGVSFTPVDAGGVPAEWARPESGREDRVVFYLHGGGYVLGGPHTHRALVAQLAGACGAHALVPDYRLAPEHPFPAAVDDALAAYRWLLRTGVSPTRVAIAGDSAGGGLTVATLLAARDAKLPLPAAAVTFSPWADLELCGESMDGCTTDPMLTRAILTRMAEAYLNGGDARAPLATPIRGDFKGLPPLLVQVGGREVLLDDSRRLVECARAAGVDATLDLEEEMIHVYQAFAPLLPEADAALARAATFIRDRWS